MKAGNTDIEVGTHIKIINSDESDLIGLTGIITHPFPGLMSPGIRYVAGIRFDQKGLFIGDNANLTKQDKFVIIS